MPPALPPDIPQVYLPVRGRAPAGCALVYQPRLLGAARIAFSDAKSRVSAARACQYLAEVTDAAIPVTWDSAAPLETAVADLEKRPAASAAFATLPGPAGLARNYPAWTRDFATWLYGSQTLELFYSPSLKAYSKPGQDERDFRIALGQNAREQRDDAVEALRKKYAPKIATLQERVRKAQAEVQKQKEQARQAGLSTAISVGATLLGAFTGRKGLTGASSAARGFGRSMNERQDIGRAEDTVEALQKQLDDLNAEFQAESNTLAARIDPATEALQTISIKPKKADITVQLVALAWAPYWQDSDGNADPAY
jgi:hypothetical protein